MAAERINETASLRMRYVDAILDGKEKLMSRTINGVKLVATDVAILGVASQLGGLQVKPLKHVVRLSSAEIIEA